jgi:8-oxo-dGTP pyrophosphatase MutT (NUDIX family)
MKILPSEIKKMLEQTLPGEISHLKMLPANRQLNAGNEDIPEMKHSSVLLLLSEIDNELTVLLIKRPSSMKFHAGQIALPGGKMENNESAVETALRETWEETGISPEKIEILGRLSDLYVQVSQFMIHPVVGWTDNFDNLNINRYEVEKVVLFPVKLLSKNIEETEIQTVTGALKVPCVKFDNEIIWGATSMILTEFVDSLRGYRVIQQ